MSTQNNEDGESRALASKIKRMGNNSPRNTAIENLTPREPLRRQAVNEPESSQVVNPSDEIMTNRSVAVDRDDRSSYGNPSQLEQRVSPLGMQRVREPAPSEPTMPTDVNEDHVTAASGDNSKFEDPRSQSHQGRAKPDLSKVNVGGDVAKRNAAEADMIGQGTQDAYLKRGQQFGSFLENSPRDSFVGAKRIRVFDTDEK
jgi:hypothetical protein